MWRETPEIIKKTWLYNTLIVTVKHIDINLESLIWRGREIDGNLKIKLGRGINRLTSRFKTMICKYRGTLKITLKSWSLKV